MKGTEAMTENLAEDLDELARGLDRDHVFHSWSAQSQLSSLVVASGRGCRVWDHAGREYLDFSSQLVNVNIGHQHPAVVQAIREQAELLTTIAPSTVSLARGEAAKRIIGHAPPGFHKVFFTNGGADANENAIRMARLHTGRDKILSTYRSYHGNTGAAIVSTGDWRRIPNEFARGHVHFFGPYLYRSEFWATTPEEESERALHHLRRVIEAEGPSSIAAILLETIPGTAGIMLPPPGYLAGVRELADRARHPAHPRRGDVRVRSQRPLVRVRRLRRQARPDHLREGRELGLRAGGRRDHLRPDRRDVRRPGVPGRTHVLGASARDGLDRRDARRDGVGGASSRTRGRSARPRSARRSPSSPNATT